MADVNDPPPMATRAAPDCAPARPRSALKSASSNSSKRGQRVRIDATRSVVHLLSPPTASSPTQLFYSEPDYTAAEEEVEVARPGPELNGPEPPQLLGVAELKARLREAARRRRARLQHAHEIRLPPLQLPEPAVSSTF